jgi:hypothetical protein
MSLVSFGSVHCAGSFKHALRGCEGLTGLVGLRY